MRRLFAICLLIASAQAGDLPRSEKVVWAWNDMVRSSKVQNALILELQTNLLTKPPGKQYDPRRAELYELILAEQKRQVRDFEIMKGNDR